MSTTDDYHDTVLLALDEDPETYDERQDNTMEKIIMTTTEKPRRRQRINPPVAEHPAVNFRVPEDMWERFGDACRALGWNRSEALRYFIAWFTWVPGSPKPIRPRYEQLTDPELHPNDDEAVYDTHGAA